MPWPVTAEMAWYRSLQCFERAEFQILIFPRIKQFYRDVVKIAEITRHQR